MLVKFSPFVLAILIWFALGSCAIDTTTSTEENTLTFDTIPPMVLYTPDGQIFSTTNLEPGTPVVFFFFNPDCPLCETSTESMLKQIEKFKELQLFFVSSDQREEVMEFSSKYNLEDYPQIKLLLDPKYEFDNKYQPTVTPVLYIYGSDLLYRGTLIGKRSAEDIVYLANKKK